MNRVALPCIVAIGVLAAAPAQAESSVFRCVEGGRVLYTDQPCRDARVVELHPGKADPAATQRLARAQAALDAGMEQKRADDARDAARREALADAQAAARAMQPPAPEPVAVADYWPVYGGYVGPVRPRPRHHVNPPPNAGGGKPRPPSGSPSRPGSRPDRLPR